MKELDKLLKGVEIQFNTLGKICDFKNNFAFKNRLVKNEGLHIKP